MCLPIAEHDASVRPRSFLQPLGVWLLLAVLASLNGIFREFVLIPRVGESGGHVLSTGLLVLVILVMAYGYFRWTTVDFSTAELVLVGALWTLLTVGFEFVVGWAEGTPVSVTLAQYDVLAGQIWIVVPLTLLVAPMVFGRYLAS